jgi:hypothetical protein
MISEKFFASVQYDDFKGTVAADMASDFAPTKWLKDNGYAADNEFLVGIAMATGENHGGYKDPLHVEFLIAPGDHDSVQSELDSRKALSVRSIHVDMPIAEFLGLFKRFGLTLSSHGMLEGKSIAKTDEERS